MLHKPVEILLVEDNRMDEELTLDAFKEARLENRVQVARTGEEALAYMMGDGHYGDRELHPLPNLILLDLKLPGISGHDVLARVKATPEIKRIPVIVLTSSQEEGDLVMSYDRGANSYLVKPVTFDGLLKTVRGIEDYWFLLNVSQST